MWFLLAAGALAVMKGNAARVQDEAGSILGEAQAQAANLVREGKNLERAAQGSAARFMQAENNKRRLQAAGNLFNSAQEELLRTNDFNIESSLERQLAAAEVSGALAANSAFAGAAGSSADVLAMTTSLKDARQRRMQEKRQRQVSYEQIKQMTGIMPQAIASLDNTYINDGIDTSRDWNQYMNKSNSTWMGDFARGAATAYIAGGAKLPSAGEGAASVTYGTKLGSTQTSMLAAQDASFGIMDNSSRAFKQLMI